jgi:hypothetical protein
MIDRSPDDGFTDDRMIEVLRVGDMSMSAWYNLDGAVSEALCALPCSPFVETPTRSSRPSYMYRPRTSRCSTAHTRPPLHGILCVSLSALE